MNDSNEDLFTPGCERCGCCSQFWNSCETCGGDGYEIVEGDPFWDEEDEIEVECSGCDGARGWYSCLGHCDENGKHEKGNR